VKRLSSLALISGVLISLAASPALAVDEDYETLLNRGLTNDEPYSYALMEEAKGAENEMEALAEARRFSPDLPAVYFRMSSAALPNVFASIQHGIDGVKAYARNFWWSLSLASLLLASLLLSLVMAAAAVVLVRMPLHIPLLTHDINEGRAKLLIPFLLFPAALGGPAFFVGGCLVMLGIHLKKYSRASAFVYLAFLAASPLLAAAMNTALSAASSPEMRAIVAVNEGRNNSYALQTLKDSTDPAARFSYGLALNRVGRHDEAIEIFSKLALEYPSDARVLNNLASAYSGKEQPDKAIEHLTQASEAAPSALVLYNLSQVYRGILDYANGDRFYQEASAMDRDLVSRYTAISSENPNRFVIDMTYSMPELWRLAFSKRREVMSPFPVGQFAAAGLAVALIILAGILFGSVRSKAFRCSRCSRIVCNICSRDSRWGQMCPECYSALVKFQEHDRQKRVSALLAAYEHRDRQRKTARMLSFLPPGIAHIYSGRAMSGLLLFWAFGFFASALILNPFVETGMAGLSHWWLNPVFAMAMAVMYASTTLYINGRLESGWL